MIDEKKLGRILDNIAETPFQIREKADYFLSEEFIEKKAIENGIPIPSRNVPFRPKLEDVEAAKEIVYGVSGFSCYFKNKKSALELQESLAKLSSSIVKLDYDYYHGDSNYKYIEIACEDSYGKLEAKTGYSQHEYDLIAAKIKRNKEITELFDKAKKDYEDKNEDYSELSNAIKKFVSEQASTASRWASLSEKYARYYEVLEPEEAMKAFIAVEKPEHLFIEWLKTNQTDSLEGFGVEQ